MKGRALAPIGLGAALLAVLSQLALPLPFGVPLTVQPLAIGLLAGWLGPVGAPAAVAVWLALGAAGVPVFAHLQGGLFHLLGYTGGFLWGFLPLCLCAVRAPAHRGKATLWVLAGTALCHLLGVAQFSLISGNGFWLSALQVSLPFFITDGLLAYGGLRLGITIKLRRN